MTGVSTTAAVAVYTGLEVGANYDRGFHYSSSTAAVAVYTGLEVGANYDRGFHYSSSSCVHMARGRSQL